ncbi:MAG: LysM peptidoglycan-binding domain-containing protein [Simkaniaceae bacterium]|nr:LysM peptidoglycan-binding domain-containing protein [Simkaniaceae bacterium]
MSLHKVRTDIEEIKHDCNTAEIELHILEGKVIDQESSIATVKDQVIEAQKSKIENLEEKITAIEKRFTTTDRKNDELKQDLRKLAKHANETTTAFAQYKDKISELENELHNQDKKFQEIHQIKESIELLVKELDKQNGDALKTYVIVDGDSIEKIARRFGTTAESIKKINQLETDLIKAGDQIYVPAK